MDFPENFFVYLRINRGRGKQAPNLFKKINIFSKNANDLRINKFRKNKRRKNMKKFFRQTFGRCELNLGFLKFGDRGKVFHW